MAELPNIFITNYPHELRAEYQRMGPMLLSTVQVETGVVGSTAEFHIIESVAATTRGSRYGDITTTQPEVHKVTATIEDHYSTGIIQKEDMLKLSVVNYRQKFSEQHALALSRKADDIVVKAMQAITTSKLAAQAGTSSTTTGMTLAKAARAAEALSDNDVGLGMRTCIVGPRQWQDLMQIKEFASADYIQSKVWSSRITDMPRIWNGAVWMTFTGLKKTNNVRQCFMYDKAAVGACVQREPTLETQYRIEKDSWQVLHALGMAAVAILPNGVVEINCFESATPDNL